MSALRKDDPVYYKVAINKLINQAKENGLEIGYEIDGRKDKITKIGICFMNDIGEMAIATAYENKNAPEPIVEITEIS